MRIVVLKNLSVAVDIGGTFTDLLAFDPETGRIHQAKCLSTPPDFATGVLDGVRKAALDLRQAESFVHGSTVAINTAIERTGAPTALIVTRGTRDVYQIARGNRPESYNILFQRAEPLAPPRLTYEIDQRTTAWGEAIVPFDAAQAKEVARKLMAEKVEAIAICFLHSYQDPADEKRMAEILHKLDGDKFITTSHEISRKSGEYERISTTVLNAYIGPRTSKYISNLQNLLGESGFAGRLLIMQSNGGLMSADTAKRVPVAMMESGPVGGVIAAAQISSNLGYENSIAFDMGGTTAKTSLVHGREPSVAEGYYIGGYADGHPAMMPVVDIVEVGTGGGSIAWIDEVGALKVGPQSAGADPGPICYRRGGSKPTVTDANVILGRIGTDSFLGGEMHLDHDSAIAVTEKLGKPLGLNAVATALSIVEIAVAKMSLAVRGVSVERGFDPRDFVMVGMGGAGPIHSVAIARQLHIPTVIIPVLPSHFSAFGMLMSDIRHDYVRTHLVSFPKLDFAELQKIFAEMLRDAERMLGGERVARKAMSFQRFLDLRYEGQEFSIKVPVSAEEIAAADLQTIRNRFDSIHDRSFGHAAPDEPLEMVNVRLSARGIRQKMQMPPLRSGGKPAPRTMRKVCLETANRFEECPVYARDTLAAGAEIAGPALIEEYGSTTVLFAGDRARISDTGEIVIEVRTVQ
jgi:N-methylhydantoinase A